MLAIALSLVVLKTLFMETWMKTCSVFLYKSRGLDYHFVLFTCAFFFKFSMMIGNSGHEFTCMLVSFYCSTL
ncbi:hypothetical protein ACQKWADRAFT_189320 [Trichoderma austrokoningii]